MKAAVFEAPLAVSFANASEIINLIWNSSNSQTASLHFNQSSLRSSIVYSIVQRLYFFQDSFFFYSIGWIFYVNWCSVFCISPRFEAYEIWKWESKIAKVYFPNLISMYMLMRNYLRNDFTFITFSYSHDVESCVIVNFLNFVFFFSPY